MVEFMAHSSGPLGLQVNLKDLLDSDITRRQSHQNHVIESDYSSLASLGVLVY